MAALDKVLHNRLSPPCEILTIDGPAESICMTSSADQGRNGEVEWFQVWATIQFEFSDLSDVQDIARVFVRMVVALLLGALLGYERETSGHAAGLRTHMLVSLGSAMFVIVPLQAGMAMEDVSRIVQGIAAGVGFLGAGAILKQPETDQIKGLTTAAGIWLTSAVGIAAGMGQEATAVLSAVFAWCLLAMLRWKTKGK
jgi:putative Mg2+ transporter-C (MgtC) family protein